MYSEGLIIDAISDTHNRHDKFSLPGGDILIHAGDATSQGTMSEVTTFLDWFGVQDYSHLIFVPGNHDWLFELNPDLAAEECRKRGIILLNDSGITVEGIKIYGSAMTPTFFDWAFNRDRGVQIRRHWDLIPADTELLITHGPPHQILDYVPERNGQLRHVGCEELALKIEQTQIKAHIFGHIHYAAGHKYLHGRTYVNAAALDEQYSPTLGNPKRIIKDCAGEYLVESAP